MNYRETLDFMYAQLPSYQNIGAGAYKPGLENTLNFLEKLGNPHQKFKSIHVAGTNGKGSCSHMLASVYAEAGYKVGLYTSPHLFDFRERIKVNGNMISRVAVTRFITENAAILEGLSFFEMCVGLAFNHFAEKKVDIAIVEVGLGGRLDATNVISPELSIITNIGLDHTALLGDTLEQIAGEKAGVIKEGVPVVIGEHHIETDGVFETKAKMMNAPLVFAQDEALSASCDLAGAYQKLNVSTVLSALKILQFDNAKAVERGLNHVAHNTGLKGRWEVLSERPLVVCDTGHNAHGLRWVTEQIKAQSYNKLFMVLGFVGDKDVTAVLEMMPKDACYMFTQPSIERALPAEKLAELAEKFGLKGEVVATVKDAVTKAQNIAGKGDMIFIGGSNFVVAEV